MSSNIQWCERNVTIVEQCFMGVCTLEPHNVLSTIGYLLVSGIGLYRAYFLQCELSSKINILLCEIFMFVMGVGSFIFHLYATHSTQLMDELPLICLVASYTRVSGYIYKTFFTIYIKIVFVWTLFYILSNQYIVFESLVTFQGLILVIQLLYTLYETPCVRIPIGKALLFFLMGKMAWDWERQLHINNLCPDSGFTAWLHVYWHILTAIMHWYMMSALLLLQLEMYF